MELAEISAIADRARPGVAWCEGCGEIAKPENREIPLPGDAMLWHTQTDQDRHTGEPIPVQCGPMHLLAIVTDAELRQLVDDDLAMRNGRNSADRLAGEACKLIDDGTRDPRSALGDALLDYAAMRHGDRDPIGDVRRTFNGLPTTKEGRLLPDIASYNERTKYLESALAYISEGRGRFSHDQQEHADNCIEDMKAVAVGAIAGTWTKEE